MPVVGTPERTSVSTQVSMCWFLDFFPPDAIFLCCQHTSAKPTGGAWICFLALCWSAQWMESVPAVCCCVSSAGRGLGEGLTFPAPWGEYSWIMWDLFSVSSFKIQDRLGSDRAERFLH